MALPGHGLATLCQYSLGYSHTLLINLIIGSHAMVCLLLKWNKVVTVKVDDMDDFWKDFLRVVNNFWLIFMARSPEFIPGVELM